MDQPATELVEVPFGELDPQTLQAVVESYVLREGTNYGAEEISHETKSRQVLDQLKSGKIKLVFDPESESCTLITEQQFRKMCRSATP